MFIATATTKSFQLRRSETNPPSEFRTYGAIQTKQRRFSINISSLRD
jgi:hypothetical protein